MGEPAILLDALALWGAGRDDDATDSADAVNASVSTSDSRAPVLLDRELNSKLSLWHGAIHRLDVDAVVNATNESLRDRSGACGLLLAAAGPQIYVECDAAGPCRTAEAVATRGCALPARFVIHTVGPKYSAKYHTAAEHALHSSYRSVLAKAKQLGARTVAVGCVYTLRKGYPRVEAAHIAARTIRRFLEHYSADFDRVVIAVDALDDQTIYEAVLPLYFPRSLAEQEQSERDLADRDLGNEFGEPVIPERQIRIGSLFDNQSEPDDSPSEDEDEAIHDFRAMSIDPDAERVERLRRAQEDRQRRAQTALAEAERKRSKNAAMALDDEAALARKSDFTDLQALDFLFPGGVDLSGAPVLVYLAANLPLDAVDLRRVEVFALHSLQTLAAKCESFSIVVVPNDDGQQAAAAWLSRLLHVFGAARHQNALRFCYVVEPTVWLKLLVLVAKRSLSGAFYRKIVYLSSSRELDNIAPDIRLPETIYSKRVSDAPEDNQEEATPDAATVADGDDNNHEGSDEAFV